MKFPWGGRRSTALLESDQLQSLHLAENIRHVGDITQVLYTESMSDADRIEVMKSLTDDFHGRLKDLHSLAEIAIGEAENE